MVKAGEEDFSTAVDAALAKTGALAHVRLLPYEIV